MAFQRNGSPYTGTASPRTPYNMAPSSPPSSPSGGAAIERHIDVDALLEDYAWMCFADSRSIKKAELSQFKDVQKDSAIFEINRKRLILTHEEPKFSNVQQTGVRPNTVFKSVFTNSTKLPQSYSLKTERTSESICGVVREQGFMFGAEAELTLKTPCEIAELKTGFKHEVHFNSLTENTKSEVLTWGVDSNIVVNSGCQTVASIVIEELSYKGTYQLDTTLYGSVTIIVKRRDGVTIMPVTGNIATIFQHYMNKNDKRLQGIVSIQGNKVKLTSKGSCQFQFAMKQYVDLKDIDLDLHAQAGRLQISGTHPSTTGYYR
uniref:DUF4097 domain-containing protein n=1 Tax=Panagrellus redivivus TaxID=6233 RepID=A0A7E4V741_PANRE